MTELERLETLVTGGRVLALTGAGVSTDSGIAEYRDDQGNWKHPQPMSVQAFLGSEDARRRYWSRSVLGWERMERAQPNGAHRALAALEHHGLLVQLVTQNVDGLHDAAGSKRVIDLHGRIDHVVCLGCAWHCPRAVLQARLMALNPDWLPRDAMAGPDGDVALSAVDSSGFVVPPCPACGGVLKPDVVFFGERVPAARLTRVNQALASARLLLVIGSSLQVFSGYRLVWLAAQRGLPLAIINRGVTRADRLGALNIKARASEVLAQLCQRMGVACA